MGRGSEDLADWKLYCYEGAFVVPVDYEKETFVASVVSHHSNNDGGLLGYHFLPPDC